MEFIYIQILVGRATLTILSKKKNKRSVDILSKLRYFLNTKTFLSLYYTLVEPFFHYCVIAWGNAYQSTLQPLFHLQKKAIRIITFSSFTEHSSPLFKGLNVLKLSDIIALQLAVFMYKFHNQLLPSVFDTFLNLVGNIHCYNTRLSSRMTYAIPKARTNYGILNIRFQGVNVWNDISDDIKLLPLKRFKNKLKSLLIDKYYLQIYQQYIFFWLSVA